MPKRLAVFLDGTWNDPTDRTNVSLLHQAALDDGEQKVHYDTGVGTGKWEKLRGGIGGYGLSKNIREAYDFLRRHHEPDDHIFLFGFSRGAFTARSLAGLLLRYGILPQGASSSTEDLYRLYEARRKKRPDPQMKALEERVKAEAVDCRVRFLGIWDTVGTLGIPFGNIPGISRKQYTFHNTRPSRHIEAACHALAIDEHRKPYDATLWTNFIPRDQNSGHIASLDRRAELEHPNIAQRWFTGAHSDVGGGTEATQFAERPMQWIQQGAIASGLRFDRELEPRPGSHLEGQPTDSFKKFLGGTYRWLKFNRRHRRQVGRPLRPTKSSPMGFSETVNESIDASVIDRFQQRDDYAPRNLLEAARDRGIDLEALDPTAPLDLPSNWRDWTP